jgi:Arc/MetJ family transcription regulator
MPAGFGKAEVHTIDCVKMGLGESMPTNLGIDDKLVEQAKRLGKHKTKKEAVNAALEEYVRKRRVEGLIELFGTIDFREDFLERMDRKMKKK